MEIATHQAQDTIVFRLRGEFTYASRNGFRKAIDTAKQKDCRLLLMDMAGLTFIDSAMLGILALVAQNWDVEGRRLAIIRPSEQVRQVLEGQNLQLIIPIHESEAAAMSQPAGPNSAAK